MNVDEDEVVDIDIEMSDQKRAEENVHGSKLGTPESKNVNRDDDSACLIHSSMWDPDGLLDPERACTARPSYCTGCSTFRIVMAPMCALVFFLAGITWVAYVFQTPGVTWIELFIFHVLLILVLSSYVQCMLLDPGTVPPGWHSTIAASPHRERFKICKKCHMYKPPRSHYDSITQRLVLNMDHFCPWMVNCIGFYNRKFFVLFLFWTTVACLFFCSAQLLRSPFNELLLDAKGRVTIVRFMALVIDGALTVAVSGFLIFHIKLVLYNQTTIESDGSRFDQGWRSNVESVFGKNPWLWLIPVYGHGPVGDGVHWKMNIVDGESGDANDSAKRAVVAEDSDSD